MKKYKYWCKRCGICIHFCPQNALEPDEYGFPVLKKDASCIRCGFCEKLCPDLAIKVVYDES